VSAPCGEDLSDTMIPFFHKYLMELFFENNVLAGAAGSPGSPGIAGSPGDRGVQGRRGRKGTEGIRYIFYEHHVRKIQYNLSTVVMFTCMYLQRRAWASWAEGGGGGEGRAGPSRGGGPTRQEGGNGTLFTV
jgi:hypothetical protein